jgi:GMP synthase-like glutamine amidotransferase
MAAQHRGLPRFGLQFHPESILTPEGPAIVRNFLELAHAGTSASGGTRPPSPDA